MRPAGIRSRPPRHHGAARGRLRGLRRGAGGPGGLRGAGQGAGVPGVRGVVAGPQLSPWLCVSEQARGPVRAAAAAERCHQQARGRGAARQEPERPGKALPLPWPRGGPGGLLCSWGFSSSSSCSSWSCFAAARGGRALWRAWSGRQERAGCRGAERWCGCMPAPWLGLAFLGSCAVLPSTFHRSAPCRVCSVIAFP